MTTWLDMKDAPRDGTPVLGWDGQEMTTIKYGSGYWYGCWELISAGSYAEDCEWFPKKWMPLPEPPKEDV